MNTGKLKGNESVLVSQLRENISSLEYEQKSSKHIAEEYVTYIEVLLIQHQKHNTKNTTQKNTTKKYNTHVQIEVELYLLELSIMDRGRNQQSVEIQHIPFQDYDNINAQLENTGKVLVVLQSKHPLHSIVYPISEAY